MDAMPLLCPGCALPLRQQPLPGRHDAHCPRCNELISRSSRLSVSAQLALAVTALLLLFMVIGSDLITIHQLGQHRSATIWTGIQVAYGYGYQVVATIVLLSSLLLPLLLFTLITMMLLIDMRLSRNLWAPRGVLSWFLTLYQWIRPWCLLEVYLISFLVSVFKLQDLATLQFGIGSAALAALAFCQQLLTSELDNERLWQHCWRHEPSRLPDEPPYKPGRENAASDASCTPHDPL